jgi:magnesium transporter
MQLHVIRELLRKQKLVEGVVRSQQNAGSDVVETLLQRQHGAEIEAALAKLPASDIARMLEDLPIDEAKMLWSSISESRKNDILWELGDPLREQLAGLAEPRFAENQMNAFELVDGRIRQVTIGSRRDLRDIRPIWIDLINASAAERAYVGQHFGLSLPDPGDETDLEVTSRFQVTENGEIHLHSNFLLDREGESRSVAVAFIIHQGTLFSLRNEDLPVFRLLRRRARTQVNYVEDCHDLLLDLYGTDVEYTADSLEDIYLTLNRAGQHVLSEKMSDQEAAAVLSDIAEEEALNGRIRSNILDTQRALAFLMQSKILSAEQYAYSKQILRNVDSLNSHTAFLFDKINFLLSATIGFININQNKRFSQLTILGVVFMPMNLLAGMGGMSEFTMMTEGIPLPVAYGSFFIGAGLIGYATYLVLRYLEMRRVSRSRA